MCVTWTGSGRYGRALLETTAILPWETAGCKKADIRGVRAPASLKPFIKTPNRLDRQDIRGVRAPASLKLARTEIVNAHNLANIRGVRAPASLKQLIPPTRWSASRVDIRGVRAPASLKPVVRIDAVFQIHQISGAFAPRPH